MFELVILAVTVPTPAASCTAPGLPAGCATPVELGPQASWLAVTTIEVLVALVGAIVGLGVVIALANFLRRA